MSISIDSREWTVVDRVSGLDEELMVALAADNFTNEGIEAESTKSVSLFLPLSLIPMSATGPMNNISLVVQLARYYEGPESPVLVVYDSYPYDDGVFHKHPVLGVSEVHSCEPKSMGNILVVLFL